MTKSTSIIFILGFALLFKLEKKVQYFETFHDIFFSCYIIIIIAVLVLVGDCGANLAGTIHVYL